MLRLGLFGGMIYYTSCLLDTKIELYYKKTPYNDGAIVECPSLKASVFRPTPWLANG